MISEKQYILTKKTVLITGASRGLGAETAKVLAAAGAHVVLLARTQGALEVLDDEIRAAGGKATLIPFDLLKVNDIDKLGPMLAERFGRLDILVANAAMLGTLGPLSHMKGREWDRVMAVNVTANFRLIRTLDPLLRASDAGRALFVTSGLAQICPAYWGGYATSKAALEAMVKTYAAEVQSTNLRVNLLDPGVMDTALLREAFPGGYRGPKTVRKVQDVAAVIPRILSPSFADNGQIIKASQLMGDQSLSA